MRSKLIKEIDREFSKYIRSREFSCCTCGSQKKLQAGHYISRRYFSLRWDERNVHSQCQSCNIFHEGNKPRYAIYLINKYGQEILETLDRESRIFKKYSISQLKLLLIHFQNLNKGK
jgi:hypothetical protein